MKLQDAFVAESGIYVGNWTMIGYNMPKSKNFDFVGAISSDTTKLVGLGKTEGWSASNQAKLNDCPVGKNWIVSVEEASTGDASKGSPIKYTAEFDATNKSNCQSLTPNFEDVGK